MVGVSMSNLSSECSLSSIDVTGRLSRLLYDMVFRPGIGGGTFVRDRLRRRHERLLSIVSSRFGRGQVCTVKRLVGRVYGSRIFKVGHCNATRGVGTTATRSLYGT